MAKRIVMMGNDAIGEAAIRCGCKFFACYPISPQTQILDYLAKEAPKRGVTFLQADSEVGAINMIIGASLAGERAMTASSSTGLALMYEGFGAAVSGEFPMLIVDVTRAGAAQAGIKGSQSDYNMLTKSFGDGGLRVPVFSPSTTQELAELVGIGFDIADKYRTPVVIMTDPSTAQTNEPVDFDKVVPDKHYDKSAVTPTGRGTHPDKKSITIVDTPHDYSGSRGPETMELNTMDRYLAMEKKMEAIRQEEMICEKFMMDDAEYVITAYGSPARYAYDAVEDLRAEGYKVGMIRPVMLSPFPHDYFSTLDSKKIKGVLSVEMCIPTGYYHDVREYVSDAIPVESLATAGGVLIKTRMIKDAFREKFHLN